MLDSSVKRPGNHLQCAAVKLTQEFRIFIVAQPDEEITCCPITVHVVSSFRTGIRSVESAVGYTYGICHSFNKCPEYTIGSVRADALRFQLIGVCQFVQQYPTRFEEQLCRIVFRK